MIALLAPTLVTLEHRVATVEAVVAELAQKTGQRLAIKAEMRDEVLFVDLKARPVDETMRLIARAASAEWFTDAGHTWLGRSPSFWRRQARLDAAATARAFSERLAPLLAPGDATPWAEGTDPVGRAGTYVDRLTAAAANDTQTHYARMRALEPGGRLLSRVLRALPAAEVAALPIGWNGRYATLPTGRQSPLPGADAASVRQYVDERRAFVSRLDAAEEETRGKVQGNLMLFSLNVPTPDAPTAKLFVRRSPGTISATLTVRDAKGRTLDQEYAHVPALSLAEEAEVRTLPGYAAWQTRKIPLGSAIRAFSVASIRPPDPALSTLLRDPVAHEPLATALADPMDALAAATGDDAIVALSDYAARLAWAFADGHDELGQFADGLSALCALRMENGTLVGPLRRPTDVVSMKANRAALRDLFRIASRGEPRLLDAARYAAAQNPEAGATGFEEAVWGGAGFGARTPNGLFDTGLRSPLRLFGDLSPAQRESLIAGGTVTVGDLSSAAREELERWVFARGIWVDGPDGVSVGREVAESVAEIGSGMRLVGSPGLVRAFGAYVGSDGLLRYEDAQLLGHILRNEEGGNHPSGWPDMAKTRFRPGVWRDFALAFVAAPGLCGHADLVDTDLDPTASCPRRIAPRWRRGTARRCLEL